MIINKYKSNNKVIYSCKYHVVWTPKYRRNVLKDGFDLRLKELLEQIAKEIKIDIIEMGIMPDHVHLLIELDPQFGVYKAIKRFKRATSRYLRAEFTHLKSRLPSLWTNSYFVSTVGGAPLEIVKLYIQNQKET